jgi:hypothetical protein
VTRLEYAERSNINQLRIATPVEFQHIARPLVLKGTRSGWG